MMQGRVNKSDRFLRGAIVFSLKAKNYRKSLILRYDMLATLLPIVYNNGNQNLQNQGRKTAFYQMV